MEKNNLEDSTVANSKKITHIKSFSEVQGAVFQKSPLIVIIGTGPAGLFAALQISQNSPKRNRILLLEKNPAPGKKLLMSGSGRCNITHSSPIDQFFSHYGDNARFLKTALKTFTNEDLIQFFRQRGLYVTQDENGKVFPSTQRATDVLDLLIHEIHKNHVEIHYNETVLDTQKVEDLFHIKTTKGEYTASVLVIATGGKSYPFSGSSGDGYRFAKGFGHSIVNPLPALTPVFIKNYPFAEISGVSLNNRRIYLYRNEKKIKEHQGHIGFTHTGLSGPGILDFSRYIQKHDILKVDLIQLKRDEFASIFTQGVEKEGSVPVKRFLKRFDLPSSLIKIILEELKIDGAQNLAYIDKKNRNRLIDCCCEFPFHVERVGGFDVAMVTAGGVMLKEVSSKTMESKLVKNLFFVGEILDIDGDTGGYNIQAAFSTAYLAAYAINSVNSSDGNKIQVD